MIRRSTQLGSRENTASSRQHASRLLANGRSDAVCRQDQSPNTLVTLSENHQSVSRLGSAFLAAPQHAATAEVRRGEGSLLTVHEVAQLLQVPVSWVYERTRRHGPERLPHFKIGKYLRFEERTLLEFIQRQHCA